MRIRFFTMLLGALLLTLFQNLPVPASAQDFDAPLLMVFKGDIWSWPGTGSSLENLTHSGGVIVGGLSPDNTKVAYAEVPELVRTAFEAHSWAGLIPHDIRLLDLATGTDTLLAGQPDDIQVVDAGFVDPSSTRTFPVWSPDGTMLAWTETVETPEYKLMLVIYSLAEKKVILTKEITEIELPTQLEWGEPGIALQNIADGELVFQVLDVEGHVVASTPSPAYGLSDYYWVQAAEGDYLFVSVSGETQTGQLFDPATGKLLPLPDKFELYAPSAPDQVSLTGTVDYGDTLALMGTTQIAFPGRAPVTPPDVDADLMVNLQYPYLAYQAAIAPDGKSVAFERGQKIVIARPGELIDTGIDVSGSVSLLMWSAPAWRVPQEK